MEQNTPEQNKTAKQWLNDRGFVVENTEQAFDLDRQAQQLEEYTKPFLDRVKELEGENETLQRQVEELRRYNDQILMESISQHERIAQLNEALKEFDQWPSEAPEEVKRLVYEALTSENQK